MFKDSAGPVPDATGTGPLSVMWLSVASCAGAGACSPRGALTGLRANPPALAFWRRAVSVLVTVHNDIIELSDGSD